MAAVLLATVGYCGYQTWAAMQSNAAARKEAANGGVAAAGLVDSLSKRLAPGFIDSTGSLLADAPKNPADYIDPAKIVVAHLDDSDAEDPDVNWKDFEAKLSTATGKPVTDMIFDSSPDQLATIKSGGIALVVLHPADAPFLVNNYGFHPLAVLGQDDKAAGNRLDIIVPAASPLSRLADLKGHVLTCTVPSSITGYRAAVLVLARDQNLRPYADYQLTWSLKQKASISGIADGKLDAAAVSDIKLESMKDTGKLKAGTYKIIYQSDVVPQTTIGCFYNLKPDLAAKIKAATLAYVPPVNNDGDPGIKFIATDYKKDFAFVRAIDDRFDPRLDSKAKKATSVDPAAAPAKAP